MEPRLALQLVHEAALCSNGLRAGRCLTLRGFETSMGCLSWPGTWRSTACSTPAPSPTQRNCKWRWENSVVPRGIMRENCFDRSTPRPSFTQRHVRKRTKERGSKPTKMAQTFFCLDGDSRQPVCFTTATSAQTISQVTPKLLRMATGILLPLPTNTLVAADAEHFTTELFDHVRAETSFDLIVPLPQRQCDQRRWRRILAEKFTPHWAGYATTVLPFMPHDSRNGPYFELVQRWESGPRSTSFARFSPRRIAILSRPSPASIPTAGTLRSSSISSSPWDGGVRAP